MAEAEITQPQIDLLKTMDELLPQRTDIIGYINGTKYNVALGKEAAFEQFQKVHPPDILKKELVTTFKDKTLVQLIDAKAQYDFQLALAWGAAKFSGIGKDVFFNSALELLGEYDSGVFEKNGFLDAKDAQGKNIIVQLPLPKNHTIDGTERIGIKKPYLVKLGLAEPEQPAEPAPLVAREEMRPEAAPRVAVGHPPNAPLANDAAPATPPAPAESKPDPIPALPIAAPPRPPNTIPAPPSTAQPPRPPKPIPAVSTQTPPRPHAGSPPAPAESHPVPPASIPKIDPPVHAPAPPIPNSAIPAAVEPATVNFDEVPKAQPSRQSAGTGATLRPAAPAAAVVNSPPPAPAPVPPAPPPASLATLLTPAFTARNALPTKSAPLPAATISPPAAPAPPAAPPPAPVAAVAPTVTVAPPPAAVVSAPAPAPAPVPASAPAQPPAPSVNTLKYLQEHPTPAIKAAIEAFNDPLEGELLITRKRNFGDYIAEGVMRMPDPKTSKPDGLFMPSKGRKFGASIALMKALQNKSEDEIAALKDDKQALIKEIAPHLHASIRELLVQQSASPNIRKTILDMAYDNLKKFLPIDPEKDSGKMIAEIRAWAEKDGAGFKAFLDTPVWPKVEEAINAEFKEKTYRAALEKGFKDILAKAPKADDPKKPMGNHLMAGFCPTDERFRPIDRPCSAAQTPNKAGSKNSGDHNNLEDPEQLQEALKYTGRSVEGFVGNPPTPQDFVDGVRREYGPIIGPMAAAFAQSKIKEKLPHANSMKEIMVDKMFEKTAEMMAEPLKRMPPGKMSDEAKARVKSYLASEKKLAYKMIAAGKWSEFIDRPFGAVPIFSALAGLKPDDTVAKVLLPREARTSTPEVAPKPAATPPAAPPARPAQHSAPPVRQSSAAPHVEIGAAEPARARPPDGTHRNSQQAIRRAREKLEQLTGEKAPQRHAALAHSLGENRVALLRALAATPDGRRIKLEDLGHVLNDPVRRAQFEHTIKKVTQQTGETTDEAVKTLAYTGDKAYRKSRSLPDSLTVGDLLDGPKRDRNMNA